MHKPVLTHTTPAVAPALVLLVGILAVSAASTFIRLAQAMVPSLAIAAWRLALASLVLAPFAVARSRSQWQSLPARDWALLITSGIFLAIHFYAWISSLALTSVTASVVLVTTNPFFVALIGLFLFRQPLARSMPLALTVAFAGSVLIGWGDLGAGSNRLLGDLLALLGAVAVACYMLIGQRLRARLTVLAYIFPVYGTAAVVLMIASLVSGTQLSRYPPQAWLWLWLVALIPQVIGHSAFNWALGYLPATFVALAVLGEPIGSTLLAWLFLDETPKAASLIGGVLILTGIAIATLRGRQVSSSSASTDL